MADEYAPGDFLLDRDGLSGTTSSMHIDTDGTLRFRHAVEITPVAELAKAERDSVSRTSRAGDMVKVASLPLVVFQDLRERGVLQDRKAFRRWLASDEASPFRTHWMSS